MYHAYVDGMTRKVVDSFDEAGLNHRSVVLRVLLSFSFFRSFYLVDTEFKTHLLIRGS